MKKQKDEHTKLRWSWFGKK